MGPLTAPHARGGPPTAWHQVDWRQAERKVQSLRSRICRATKEQRWKQVRHRTQLLLRSYANVLVSVRRITQVNRGRHTPGIDGECVTTPEERAKLVDDFRQNQPWKAAPVRRVYIPKAKGKQRPLGMPRVWAECPSCRERSGSTRRPCGAGPGGCRGAAQAARLA